MNLKDAIENCSPGRILSMDAAKAELAHREGKKDEEAALPKKPYTPPAPIVTSLPPPPPADHSQVTLPDGSPVTPDHRELKPNGQQKAYVVLSEEERAKGFVRPVRRTYTHLKCMTETTMGHAIAETYARSPGFYGATFCVTCGTHFRVGAEGEFTWEDGTKVGT